MMQKEFHIQRYVESFCNLFLDLGKSVNLQARPTQ